LSLLLTAAPLLKKVWNIVNKIAGKRSPTEVKHLQDGDKEVTSLADIADTLAENFSEVSSSRHYNAKFQLYKERTESHRLRFNLNNTETYNTYFTMDELLDSLAKSSDSAVGPDDFHYKMLKHLPSDALQSLLNTLNNIWLTGNFPPSWRQSHIVPSPKPGKDSSDPSNYRPI